MPLTAEQETTEHSTFLALARAAADGFRVLSMSADGGSSDDIGGAICWYSTSYVPVFNGASILDPDLINQTTLSAIEGYFRPRPECARSPRPRPPLHPRGLRPPAASPALLAPERVDRRRGVCRLYLDFL